MQDKKMQDKKNEVLTVEQLNEVVNDFLQLWNVDKDVKTKVDKILNNQDSKFLVEFDEISIWDNEGEEIKDLQNYYYYFWGILAEDEMLSMNDLSDLMERGYTLEMFEEDAISDKLENDDYDVKSKGIIFEFKKILYNSFNSEIGEKSDEQLTITVCYELETFNKSKLKEHGIIPMFLSTNPPRYLPYIKDKTPEEYIQEAKYNTRLFLKEYWKTYKISAKILEKLVQIAILDERYVELFVSFIQTYLSIENSRYKKVVKDFKAFYKKRIGIKPTADNFKNYLRSAILKHNELNSYNNLKKHLDKFVIKEKYERLKSIKEIESNYIQIIDITPQKILFIEAPAPSEEVNASTLPANEENKKRNEIYLPSFKSMFKDESQLEIILRLIKEDFLNDLGEWKSKVVYMSAFYGVLKERGYFKQIYSATQIHYALTNQFKIECIAKNFQPQEMKDAVYNFENAFLIPTYNAPK